MTQAPGDDGWREFPQGWPQQGRSAKIAGVPSPVRRPLLLGVPFLVIAVTAVVLVTRGSGAGGVQAEAASVCTRAQGELKELFHAPGSLPEALGMVRSMLETVRREVVELQALGSGTGAPFQAGLADVRKLVTMYSSMLGRHNFVYLATTLPYHPHMAPAWARRWVLRLGALKGDARTHFAQAGISACEKSLG